jgi:type I restriction enzyme, R subunit
MSEVDQVERVTQNRVVKLFRDQLKYRYLGNLERRANRNIEEDMLRDFLQKKGIYSNDLINRALYELNRVAGDQVRSIYDINKEVYGMLRYGVNVKMGAGAKDETVKLIDWGDGWANNDFAFAEEVAVKGKNDKRPDIVLYVNGIALAVMELKRVTVDVSTAIRQSIDNQHEDYIQRFFTTVQLVLAGNDTQGLYYGTTGTTEKQFDYWREESTIVNLLDKHLTQLCSKERLLEIIHDFIIFDHGVKKVCRPHQYFGVIEAQKRVRSREGGIIWHSQGSGKSLTMVWLAKWIYEHIPAARVLIVTDRTELDEQIEGIFLGVGEKIVRTKSGKDLVNKLGASEPWLLCSLIHKFAKKGQNRKDGNAEEGDVDAFIEEMKRDLPSNFKPQGDIFVFVDECHRTQSGKLRQAMKEIVLPNAMYIGFTGTPLLKTDKQTSIEIFGTYIHTYRFNEAVEDKVVLDLRYEARDINQYIGSQERVDQWFENRTRGLTDAARARLKQKWGTMQKVLSSEERLKRIVTDIVGDMEEKPRLASRRGNALLVVDSIYQACKIYELFSAADFHECAIVTSYNPSRREIKGESSGEGQTEKLRQFEIYKKMLKGKTTEAFEKDVKEQFIKQPGQMRLLIVVDKLLTGFDAPSASYLYIDKQMRNHGLFQAICRVNRLDGEDKDYGYIVDYQDLFKSLERSILDYTSDALSGYDKDDVKGLLKNRIEKGREDLDEAREQIKALCEPVPASRTTEDYIRYFCGDTADKDALTNNEPRRVALYKFTNALIRTYLNLASDMAAAGYSEEQRQQIKEEVDYYTTVSAAIKRASQDYPDLKQYEPAMRRLLDDYVRADDSKKLSAFDDISLIELIVKRGREGLNDLPEEIKGSQGAMAETIENNLRRVIVDEMPTNPMYYEKMSEVLDTLIQERRQRVKDYEQYLKEIVELTQRVQDPASAASYPSKLNTRAKRALYNNLGNDEKRALAVDDIIRKTKRDGWNGGNIVKEREVLYAIQGVLQDDDLGKRIFDIAKNQDEYNK